MAQGVLHVPGRVLVHARERPALHHARGMWVVPAQPPAIHHDGGEDGEVSTAPAVWRQHSVGKLLSLAGRRLTEVLVYTRLEPLVRVFGHAWLVVQGQHAAMTEIMIATGILLLRERRGRTRFALSAVLVQAGGHGGPVSLGGVGEVLDRVEPMHLPVCGQTMALEGLEHLQTVIFPITG